MFGTMSSRVLSAGVLLVAAVSGVCLAEIVIVNMNINPHKIVLNAQGQSDDIQANIPIILTSVWEKDFNATLYFNDEEVAQAESARYCYDDDILIIDFDRTDLQNNPIVQALANTTVTATVIATVTNADGETTTTISGSDTVEIVEPGKKGR